MQSFPDWWSFSGTSRHPIRQIGNAVPPILGAAIGSFLLEKVFNKQHLPRREVWEKLGQQHLLTAEDEKTAALQPRAQRALHFAHEETPSHAEVQL